MDRSCDYPSIYVKSEIEVKDEPLDVEEKDAMDDQLFEFVSVPVKEENEVRRKYCNCLECFIIRCCLSIERLLPNKNEY